MATQEVGSWLADEIFRQAELRSQQEGSLDPALVAHFKTHERIKITRNGLEKLLEREKSEIVRRFSQLRNKNYTVYFMLMEGVEIRNVEGLILYPPLGRTNVAIIPVVLADGRIFELPRKPGWHGYENNIIPAETFHHPKQITGLAYLFDYVEIVSSTLSAYEQEVYSKSQNLER